MHANATTANLVFITRANPPAGGADLGLSLPFFPGCIHGSVVGHDDVGIAADDEILRGYRKTMVLQTIHFLNQHAGVDHHAVADQASLRRVEDPGGNEMKDMLLVIDDKRVTGVVSSLEAHHAVSLFGEQVNNLAFSFISPLGANNNDICHEFLFPVALAFEQGRAKSAVKDPDRLQPSVKNHALIRW